MAEKERIVDALLSYGEKSLDGLGRGARAIRSAITPSRETVAKTAAGMIPGAGYVQASQDMRDAGEHWRHGNVARALISGGQGVANAGLETVAPMLPSLAIFAGPAAKTADLSALMKAESLDRNAANNGLRRGDIWDQTGWDVAKNDGVPRFEIDDSKAKLTQQAEDLLLGQRGRIDSGTIGEVLDHPALFAAYPDLARIPVDARIAHYGGSDRGGSYSPSSNRIEARGMNQDDTRSILLHELQHAVQKREGMARGSNPEVSADPILDVINLRLTDVSRAKDKASGAREAELAAEYDVLLHARSELMKSESRHDLYRRTPGEVEARNVQEREHYSPERRRESRPWVSEDVPESRQRGRGDVHETLAKLGIADIGVLPPRVQEAVEKAAAADVTMASAPAPIKAYHGSPHDFDKFDLSKLGTGEGAQAYGHGLYFAENEGVARDYRKRLAGDTYQHLDTWFTKADTPEAAKARAVLKEFGNDPHAASAVLDSESDQVSKAAASLIREAKGQWAPKTPGKMYEVGIHTSPERLLDWDKPASAQSETVKRAIAETGIMGERPITYGAMKSAYLDPIADTVRGTNAGRFLRPEDFLEGRADMAAVAQELGPERFGKLQSTLDDWRRFKELRGSDVYHTLARSSEGELGGLTTAPRSAEASETLREAGIDGIRYLDGGSRNAGEGSRNIVTFRDDIVQILKKYGLPIAALPPSVLAVIGLDSQQPAVAAER